VKLIEALQVINQSRNTRVPAGPRPFKLGLCCGFVPLHFKTFLTAQVTSLSANREVEILEGLYGDVCGNLERLSREKCDGVAAAIEWADLDSRLGVRSTGGWHPAHLSDIVTTAEAQLSRIMGALKQLGRILRVVSGPTLPLPPIFYSRPARLSSFEAELGAAVARFHWNAIAEGVVVLAPRAVDAVSSSASRLDVKSELSVGFPYTLEHADALAHLFACELSPPPRKKGLITDLDDTLWRGILGEIGIEGVCWTLDRNAHVHALYQQFLGSLAASGTLVAIASKNSPELVTDALGREDLLMAKDSVFPVEAHWGPKSQSVSRILAAWNIAPDAVVFVDDSPMELAEVKAAYPEIECVRFNGNDPAALWKTLARLREYFGASELTKEDSLRLESLRARAGFDKERESTADPDAFLRQAGAKITFLTGESLDGKRAFDLLNKTNQFNLNGTRLSEAEWTGITAGERGQFVVTTEYSDRYGPLGVIAVLVGSTEREALTVHYWVMSCRAFSRRIEHRTLKFLFDRFGVSELRLAFHSTPRNAPLQEFLAGLIGSPASGEVLISRASFDENCPELYHSIQEV
jgi:FkbH-like protein